MPAAAAAEPDVSASSNPEVRYVRAGRSCATTPEVRAGGPRGLLMACDASAPLAAAAAEPDVGVFAPLAGAPAHPLVTSIPPAVVVAVELHDASGVLSTMHANPSKLSNPWVSNRSTSLHYGLGGLV